MYAIDYIWSKKDCVMRLSEVVKSISYLKANAANLIEEINRSKNFCHYTKW